MKAGPIAAVLLGVIAAAIWWWWPTDARRIEARLREMADALSVAPATPDLERLARGAVLASGLAPDVEVHVGGRVLVGRDQVLAAARAMTAARATGGAPIDVSLDDVAVTVEGDTAAVRLVVVIDAGDDGGDDAAEAAIAMARRQGEWVVTRVERIEALQRPGTGAP